MLLPPPRALPIKPVRAAAIYLVATHTNTMLANKAKSNGTCVSSLDKAFAIFEPCIIEPEGREFYRLCDHRSVAGEKRFAVLDGHEPGEQVLLVLPDGLVNIFQNFVVAVMEAVYVSVSVDAA